MRLIEVVQRVIPFNAADSHSARCGGWLIAVAWIAVCALGGSVSNASLDGTSDSDRAASIDWPMYDDPFLAEIPLVQVYDARLKAIWRASLSRPDVETRRRAAYEIGLAARLGMPDLADLAGPLLDQLNVADGHPAMLLAAAQALILLDARQAAASLLGHNERGGASGVMRGGTVPAGTQPEQRHGGIEMVLLTDPALARWNHEAARELWIRRAQDGNLSPRMRISAIDALQSVKHPGGIAAIRAIALDRKVDPSSLRLHAARACGALMESGLEVEADALQKGTLLDRLVAVSLLSRHTGKDALAALLKLAADAEPSVASPAIARLLELDPSLLAPLTDGLLRSPDVTIRLLGTRAVAAVKTPAAIAALAPMLDDLNPAVRREVRERFIEFHKDAALAPAVVEHSVKLLTSTSWRSLEQAAIIVGRIDHEASVARLVELLPHRRGEVRIAAIIALRRIGITDASVLAAIHAHAQREAEAWLVNLKIAEEKTHLPLAVDPDRDRELAQIIQLMGIARYEAAGQWMERFISKTSGYWNESRSAAIWSLGLLHEDKPDERLAGEFATRLSDLDPNNPERLGIRRMAAIGIGRMKAMSAIKTLQAFYDSERTSRHVGGACRWSLMRMTGKDLPPLPSREMSETGWFIRPLEAPPVIRK